MVGISPKGGSQGLMRHNNQSSFQMSELLTLSLKRNQATLQNKLIWPLVAVLLMFWSFQNAQEPTVGEGWNVDWLVYEELHHQAQLHHISPIQHLHQRLPAQKEEQLNVVEVELQVVVCGPPPARQAQINDGTWVSDRPKEVQCHLHCGGRTSHNRAKWLGVERKEVGTQN